jgi:hypothetical protein
MALFVSDAMQPAWSAPGAEQSNPRPVIVRPVNDAQQQQSRTVVSPDNRVVLLELFTSEGCSSCPPADRFMSSLKQAGISSQQIIPLAYHVTYWDYIGWQDRFAKPRFDQRQRSQARKQALSTVYTPQFMMSGSDYRRYSMFDKDVANKVKQVSPIRLELTSRKHNDNLQLQLSAVLNKVSTSGDNNKEKITSDDVGLYFAVVENNLSSDVDAGENEGETLHHDYVVRKLYGPFKRHAEKGNKAAVTVDIQPDWKPMDLQIVAFAESLNTGEILQAVRMKY